MIQKNETIIEKTQKIVLFISMILFIVPWFVVGANVFFSFADMELLIACASVCILAAVSFFATAIILEVLSDFYN